MFSKRLFVDLVSKGERTINVDNRDLFSVRFVIGVGWIEGDNLEQEGNIALHLLQNSLGLIAQSAVPPGKKLDENHWEEVFFDLS